jgi:outer membrane protein assembly factor BamB
LVSLAYQFSSAAAASPSLAEQALSSLPRGKGLCIHLGCGGAANPALMAELAARSQMLVHGLATDDASAERAWKAIEAAGMTGQASVERLRLSPLPYMPNLANLIVIEDWKRLAVKGLARDEVMRVLAPGGTLCVLEHGKWTRTVKPRPAEMDDWPHPMHDVGWTRTSKDKTFSFPIGLRWTDGLPNNINSCTDCRGWVVVKDMLFTLSAAEPENLGQGRKEGYDLWLSARDAFNGLPLWKFNVHVADKDAAVNAFNVPTLAADDQSVYTAYKSNCVIRVDSKMGKILSEQPAKYAVNRLVLAEGVVVIGSWATKNNDWCYFFPSPDTGCLEAFDAATGRRLWQMDVTPEQITASDGVIHVQVVTKVPRVIGVDLHQGKELWRVEQTEGDQPKLKVVGAGPNYVVITHVLDKKQQYSSVLASQTGKVILDGRVMNARPGWIPVVDGLVWFAGRKYDPATWKEKGQVGMWFGGHGCVAQTIVWPYLLGGRGGDHVDMSPIARGGRSAALSYCGARSGCIEGMVVANGMLYTAQNICKCMPSHLYGFLGLGPCGREPTAEDFAAAREVEKGPAFGGPLATPPAAEDATWPMLRADAARSASARCSLPVGLQESWSVQITPEGKGPLAAAWDSQLTTSLSAPVVAEGLVFAAACDQGQIVACKAGSGKRAWTATLGSRIDGPPTYHRGLCFVGCHDGFVYALRAKNGQLAWRVQVAPWSRRIVDHGRVESLWPAPASVLALDGVVYATAGRTSESDGGIALVALDAATGKTVWARQIGVGALRMNDILSIKDGQLAWRYMRIDKTTGKMLAPASLPTLKDTGGGGGKLEGGIMDGTYTMANNRRAGQSFELGGKRYDLLAWNDRLAVAPQLVLSSDGQKEVARIYTLGYPRATALALAPNAAVYCLRSSQYAQPGAKGMLKTVSLETGKAIQELPLPGPTTYDGLAIAGGKVFVSLQDGKMMCFCETNDVRTGK